MSQRRGEMALRARADKANQADARAMPLFAVGVSKPWAGSAQDEELQGRPASRRPAPPWRPASTWRPAPAAPPPPGAPPRRPRS